MKLTNSTAIAAALIASIGLMLMGVGIAMWNRWGIVPFLAGTPWLAVGCWLWHATHSYMRLDMESTQPKKAEAQPAQADGAHRGDKWKTMNVLIHDWARNGLLSAGDGNPTGIAPSRELAQRSKLPFSSEIWGEARSIALEMRYNGGDIFVTQRGKGGEQLVVVQRIPGDPFNHIEAEWRRLAGKHMLRAGDRRAGILT